MRRHILLVTLACIAVAALCGPALSQPPTEATKPTAGAPAGGEQKDASTAAMEAWIKLNAPGEPHKLLAGLAGDWDLEVKSWAAPDAPPTTSKATATSRLIMDARFLQDEFAGSMMDMPFTGMGLTGYDNMKRQYVALWIDSMTTGIFISYGVYDSTAKVLTMTGTTVDPVSGDDVRVRTITRFVDDDQHVFEWYQPGPDGKEMKGMAISYTRKK